MVPGCYIILCLILSYMTHRPRYIILFILLIQVSSIASQSLTGLKSKTIKIDNLMFIRQDGFIEVPEDREKNGSRMLKLPVRIIKSSGDVSKEPVFYLDGGPGGTNISSTTNTLLLQNHDLIFVGYRGVDGSTILTNKKLGKAMMGKDNQLLSNESIDNITTAIRLYFGQQESKGINISSYTIMDVIEDLEYTRKTLGYGKINLLGFSYGTRVALLYSHKYPESINRIVLAGANPPGHFYWFPEKTDQILKMWDDLYKARSKGSVIEAMKKAFDSIPEKWSFYKLDKDKIKCTAFLFMSQNDMAVMMFDSFFRAADKNDYSGLYALSLFFDMAMKKIVWGDMYSKGASADMVIGKDYRAILRDSGNSTVLGPNMSLLLWGSIDGWNKSLIPEEYRKMRVSMIETLIVSGDLDVPTPTDFAREELLPYLPEGQHVTLKDISHGDIQTSQPEAYYNMITSFFDTGKADTTLYKPQEIDLDPDRKLYKIAKWGYPAIVIYNWFN